MSQDQLDASTSADEDVELLEAEKELAEARARLLKARNRRREKKKELAEAKAKLLKADTPTVTPKKRLSSAAAAVEILKVTPKKRLSAKRRRKQRLSEDSAQKRTPKPENQQILRQMLGKVLKLNVDERLLAREFIGPQNVFDLPNFEDAVDPILDYFVKTDDIDTCGFTRYKMFRILVDVAKKRSDYTPKKKK